MTKTTIPLTASLWIGEGDIDESGLQLVIDATRLYSNELEDLINVIPVESFDDIVRETVQAYEKVVELKAAVKRQVEWADTQAMLQLGIRLAEAEASLKTAQIIIRSLSIHFRAVSS